MVELWNTISAAVRDHWTKIVVAGAFSLVGWWVGRYRARRQWRTREFYDRINFTLTSIENGAIRIRTILETRCENVFLNSAAAEAVINAARNTTESNPILPLPKEDYWFYLNAVLNEVSERFAMGEMRRDLGGQVLRDRYLIALTSECAGPVRTRKVRAMLVKKSFLENLPVETPRLESPSHITRWQTVNQLAAAWKVGPHQFLELEICVA